MIEATPPVLTDEKEAVLLEFEAAWEQGRAPDLLTPRYADLSLDAIRELVIIDMERRFRGGLPVEWRKYLEAFPALAAACSEGDLATAAAAVKSWLEQRNNQIATSPASLRPEPAALVLPEIPGYRLIRVLGTGGMSVVYEATAIGPERPDTSANRVAIKLVKAGAFGSDEARQRFRREIAILSQLRHLHVVSVLVAGSTEDGQDFLVMEYLAGGSLPATLRAPDEAARLIESLARAVGYLHKHQIVHRDLKPSNVLLTADRTTAKIADLGLAKFLDGSTTTHMIGTPLYMSPEQVAARSETAVGPPTDVYSLGVMLYQFLCGALPLPGLTPQTMGRLLREEPISLRRQKPAVPADLETICHKCLEKRPARRYANGDELADDLLRYRHQQRVAARPVSQFGRLVRRAERNLPLACALGILTLILLLGCGVAGWGAWKYTADIRAARDTADEHRIVAERQRKMALEYVRRIAEEINQLENRHPELTDVRLELLIEVQKYLRELVEDPAPGSESEEVEFWLVLSIGDMYRDHDPQYDQARLHYQRALAMAERTKDDTQGFRLRRRLRSFALSRLGDTERLDGHFDEAMTRYREMLRIRQDLHVAATDSSSRKDLAVAHLKIGDGLHSQFPNVGEAVVAEMEDHYEKCHELYRLLVADWPDDLGNARMFAHSCDRLTDVHLARKEWAKAIESSESARQFRKSAVARFPRCELVLNIENAHSLHRQAHAHLAAGQFEQARRTAEEALRVCQDFYRLNPKSNWFKGMVDTSNDTLAEIARAEGKQKNH